jgi:hypothetical protein
MVCGAAKSGCATSTPARESTRGGDQHKVRSLRAGCSLETTQTTLLIELISASCPNIPGSFTITNTTPGGAGDTVTVSVTYNPISPVTAPFPQPVAAPLVTIDGQPAQVLFYAEAPGLVAGVLQINVRIPTSVSSGAVPVVVSIGGASSQLTANGTGAVTVSVQ